MTDFEINLFHSLGHSFTNIETNAVPSVRYISEAFLKFTKYLLYLYLIVKVTGCLFVRLCVVKDPFLPHPPIIG